MDGYYPMLLEKTYDWEREDVEDIIWNGFVDRKDSDMAMFMPKLKKYNGMEALKSKLEVCTVPSGGSVNIAETLYITTNEIKYLNLMIENYEVSPDSFNRVRIVSKLSRLAKYKDVYTILISIYINDNNDINQIGSLCGILWADGYLIKMDDLNEISSKIEFLRFFKCETSDKRRKAIMKYKNGELKKFSL